MFEKHFLFFMCFQNHFLLLKGWVNSVIGRESSSWVPPTDCTGISSFGVFKGKPSSLVNYKDWRFCWKYGNTLNPLIFVINLELEFESFWASLDFKFQEKARYLKRWCLSSSFFSFSNLICFTRSSNAWNYFRYVDITKLFLWLQYFSQVLFGFF